MTQHYVPPADIVIPVGPDWPKWPSRFLKRIIERDGLIVPVLVNQFNGSFIPADDRQAERVMACAELGFETVLIETEWEADDL